MTARAVLTAAAGDHHDDHQQDHDGQDDPEHLHPARCASIGERVNYVRLLSGSIYDSSLSVQFVFVKSVCFIIVIPYILVYWNHAEALERDDRGAPAGGARRDPGDHLGASSRAWAAIGEDVADRREGRHRTCDA